LDEVNFASFILVLGLLLVLVWNLKSYYLHQTFLMSF